MAKTSMPIAVAVVTPQGAQRLRRGNPWVYRQDIASAPDPVAAGAVVQVVDGQHNPIGQAFWSKKSPVALRLLTRDPPEKTRVDGAFFRARIESALKRRSSYQGRDAYRLIHGEADLLPGLLVDRYGEGITVQTLSEGADARKEELASTIAELVGAKLIALRDDASGRDFEGLPREKRLLRGEGSARVQFHEGPNRFEVDLLEDMKTGSFLDQVDNHLRAGELAHGEALDCFSYHGGFALALSVQCSSVLAVDQDEGAAKQARENAQKNGRTNVTVEAQNAFDALHAFDREGRKFDTIVIDPPGMAKRKEGIGAAMRAYHELNLRALRCLRPDGLLVSCSCSGKVTREAFDEMVVSAAQDAKRSIHILERRGAGLDHPVLASLPETEYLKAWFVRVL